MTALHLTHLVIVALWGGVVVAETAVELLGTRHPRAAAEMHFWIDVAAELPLLLAVLVTGGLLVWQVWPLTSLHWIKVGAGLGAVLLNLACAVAVVVRYRQRTDAAAVTRWSRWVRASALGVPLGLAAAYLGLRYFA